MAFRAQFIRRKWVLTMLVVIVCAFLYQGYYVGQSSRSTKLSVTTVLTRRDGTPDDDGLLNTDQQPLILRRNFHKYYGLGEIYRQRKVAIEDACDKSKHGYFGNSEGAKVAKRLVIDRRRHLVYCPVQKVGSTFLRSLLRNVNKKGKDKLDNRKMREKHKNSTDVTDFHYILTSSFKMMFTRDPYTRLFSGYIDKLFTVNTMYWHIIGTYIKNTLLQSDNATRTHCGHGITFPQFIKYVITSQKSGVHTDGHFTPIYEHCRPCQISYDFIGKMETFSNDTLTLLNAWNKRYGANITYGDFEVETASVRIRGQIGRLYSMRKGFEKCVSFYSAMQRIWKDLQIRGFLTKMVELPFSRAEAENISVEEMQDAVTKAVAESSIDRTELHRQQLEAMTLAYSNVPMRDLLELREIVRPDCELFGYDVSPDFIFNRKDRSDALTTFKYFDIDE
ncbi:carbohydrate sulfotransferase 8-like [Argopecten irradians]|uniref:carbohydrate sulfotransferase 8-like n=1 Tax=Argopecten irradians TaxID=31199 RepID=UPI00371B5318